jgi:hypothetical protein
MRINQLAVGMLASVLHPLDLVRSDPVFIELGMYRPCYLDAQASSPR